MKKRRICSLDLGAFFKSNEKNGRERRSRFERDRRGIREEFIALVRVALIGHMLKLRTYLVVTDGLERQGR